MVLYAAFVSLVIFCVMYAVYKWLNSPDKALMRSFKRMRTLILKGIDDSQQQRAERLLKDCEDYLDMILLSQKRLEELESMRKKASMLYEGVPSNMRQHEDLRAQIKTDMDRFLAKLYKISSEVTFDWKQSLEELEEFTSDLETQREVYLDLASKNVEKVYG